MEYGEAKALTFELMAPAHDGITRVGASVRVMHRQCWLGARLAQAELARRAASKSGRVQDAASNPGPMPWIPPWLGCQRASLSHACCPLAFCQPAALFVGRNDGAEAAGQRAASAVAHYHRTGAALGSAWEARQLPWRHALERTRVDALMGAPLVWRTAKEAARTTRCQGRMAPSNGRPSPRPLHWLVISHMHSRESALPSYLPIFLPACLPICLPPYLPTSLHSCLQSILPSHLRPILPVIQPS